MSASTALLEVLKALRAEAACTPEIRVPYWNWTDYRQRQELCNPNYSRACELERPYDGWQI